MARLLLVALAGVLSAQDLRLDRGAFATHQALKRLQTTISVLHITAHPDDEDAALLTTLSRGYGFRTALLSLNRGEGGANLAGPEMYDALGILRTEETLAAARHYGVELFYTRAVDFGFSKRMDETLEHWGKDNVLRDVVKFVRRWRPDIIIARFHGLPRDGHGNHQTAGLMAIEAFRDAADARRFPEAGPAWAVKKLYLSARPNEPSTLRVETGIQDPFLGLTYRQLGALGYRQHRTQGMAAAPAPMGPAASTLRLIENRVGPVAPETSITAGLNEMTLPSVDMKTFDAAAPAAIVPALAKGLREVRAQLSGEEDNHLRFLLRNREAQFGEAINHGLGLQMDALVDPAGPGSPFETPATFAVATPGQKFTVSVRAVIPGGNVEPVAFRVLAPSDWTVREVKRDGLLGRYEIAIPADAKPTRPYWSRASEYRDYLYSLDEVNHEYLPFSPAVCRAEFRYRVAGVDMHMVVPVQTQTVDRLHGPQRRNLAVAPAVSVSVDQRSGVIPAGNTTYRMRVLLRANAAIEGTAFLRLPEGWKASPEKASFRFATPGEVQQAGFSIELPPAQAGKRYGIQAVVEAAGRTYTEGYQEIGYRGLEPHPLFRPARLDLAGVNVKVAPGVRVAYLPGAGDETAAAIAQLGVPVETLAAQDLQSADLSRFTAIVIGVRASAVRDDWKAHRERLIEYVENGGHLIVQYQTQEFDEAQYGPYPYKLTARAEEVSEESARVTILHPEHPLFTAPNRITAADFDGWVEERGSKWMSEWDPRYVALLESHDREQAPQKGGLLIGKYGEGYWTYLAYALYRQLPAGVPGAYRLIANAISLTAR